MRRREPDHESPLAAMNSSPVFKSRCPNIFTGQHFTVN